MAALARLLIIGFVVCTIIYVSLLFYARAAERERLRERWEQEGCPGDLDSYVARGLEAFNGSLRRRLILGVYVVPLTLIVVIIYFTNFH